MAPWRDEGTDIEYQPGGGTRLVEVAVPDPGPAKVAAGDSTYIKGVVTLDS